jgi:hypothetical protein
MCVRVFPMTVPGDPFHYKKCDKLLQYHLNRLEQWLKRWHIQANGTKSTHVTFTLKRGECPVVLLNGKHIPQDETVKYLGIHLDRRLTWKTHIFTKRKHLWLMFQRVYWILDRKSELSLANKLLLYKTILNPYEQGRPLPMGQPGQSEQLAPPTPT